MKNSLLIFMLFLCALGYGQSVDDTESFTLQDVYDVVNAHASPSPNLQSCFDHADTAYFDPQYNNDTYALANSLLRFRNYTIEASLLCIWVPGPIYQYSTLEATCSSMDGIPRLRRSDSGDITNASVLYTKDCSIVASPGWYKDDGSPTVRYWDGNSFTVTATCSPVLPDVGTEQASEVTTNSAVSGGIILRNGWDAITSKGICYNTIGNPDIYDNTVSAGSGDNDFTCTLSNLSPNTTYYIKAYAVNSAGVGYGEQQSFTTAEQQVACGGSASHSGVQAYPGTYAVTLGSETGFVTLNYNAQSVPDLFMVEIDGEVVANTGYRGGTYYDYGGSSRNTFTSSLFGKVDPTGGFYPNTSKYPEDGYPRVTFPGADSHLFIKSSSSSIATVKVYAPMSGTAWNFTLNCPQILIAATGSENLTAGTSTFMATSEEVGNSELFVNEESILGSELISSTGTTSTVSPGDQTIDLSYTIDFNDTSVDVEWLAVVKEGTAAQNMTIYVSHTGLVPSETQQAAIKIKKGESVGRLYKSYSKTAFQSTPFELSCWFDTDKSHEGYVYGNSPVLTITQ